jgi:hypothetical protein
MPALRRLADVVRLADSADSFSRQIEDALAEGRDTRKGERQAEAARHSWASRFDELTHLLETHMPCAS